jgi:hypothetical protein
MRKKAVSTLVATVLLVLITIAAVGIIWGAIMPIIRTNIEKSQKCFDVGLELKKTGNTCFDPYAGELYIQVSRGENPVDISDIQIQVGYAGTTRSIRISNSTYVIVNNNTIPGQNEEVKYTINTSALNMDYVDYASIAAVLMIGRTESLCSATPQAAISTC